MNPVASTPDSVHEFTRRMVACNIKKSLEPLGDEALARDQSIQKFALVVLRDWLPRFSDQGNSKAVGQLCSQIKKYFTDDPAQDKVNALASQIQVTCSSACSGRRAAWMEQIEKDHRLRLSPQARLEAALKPHRSKEDQIVCCQWMMSALLHECERMHAMRKLFVLQHEIEQNRNRSFTEQTQFTFNGTEMEVTLEFPADQVREFDEVCFWLNFNQMKKSVEEIEQELLRSIRSNDRFGTRDAIERFQAHVKKISDAVAALSGYNPVLRRVGEELLFHIEGKIFMAAISCLKLTDAVQPIRFARAPGFLHPMQLMDGTAKYFSLVANKTLSPNEATDLYFAHFEDVQALYAHCKQTRDALLGAKDPVKYNLSRIQNTAASTLPETIELEPWVALDGRAALLRDELLAPYLRAEPPAPPAAAPLQPKKKADKSRPRELRPLQFSTTEEKHRLDEESSPKEAARPSVWAPLPSRPSLPERRSAPPVELTYAPRVERWFAEERQADDFSEYGGNPSPQDLCYHAFPLEIDAYAASALEQVWINTATGFPDRQLLIPAEFTLPDALPVRGVISYAIGQDGVCYHRCFHPMRTADLVEKFGFQRFEKADFPALASEKETQGKGRGLKPNRGRKVQQNPALGTVTFRDDRSGAQIQIFTG